MTRSPQSLVETAWAKLDDDDPNLVVALASEALEAIDAGASADDELRGEALLVRAHALILEGESDDARADMALARPLLADDPELLTDAANVALALGQPAVAAELADRAVALEDTLADATYARGLAAEALGDRDTAIAMFLRTAESDAQEPDPPWAMTVDNFAALAEQTLQELPPVIIERLENVPIIVEAAPPDDLIKDGVDPRLLGLFSGVPLTEKSTAQPGEPSLDAIHLFQRNLERTCADRDELIAEIRITVLHETAHFFGLDDNDLDALGLG